MFAVNILSVCKLFIALRLVTGEPVWEETLPCVSHRGVTRLDGARGKKQVWRPHVFKS